VSVGRRIFCPHVKTKPNLKDVAADDSLGHYAIMFAAAMGAEVYVSVETYLKTLVFDDSVRLTSAVYPLDRLSRRLTTRRTML
jgi:hypothetical protein